MSRRDGPIDEKWLDRPRAKRSSDRPSSNVDDSSKKHCHKKAGETLSESENSRWTEKLTKKGDSPEVSKSQRDIHQTNLFSFFSSSSSTKKQSMQHENDKISPQHEGKAKTATKKATPAQEKNAFSQPISAKPAEPQLDQPGAISDAIPKPMIPSTVSPPQNVIWNSPMDSVIIRKVRGEKPRKKVAAMDLDGTLTVWRISGWPSRLEHYELWSSTIPSQLRSLHDDGHKLVIFSNQGAIRKSHDGKKATLVKNVINWIAGLVDRPIHAVMSTKSLKNDPTNSYHKPSEKMWDVAIRFLNNREPFDVTKSFFVGDSADVNDEQGGVDLRFAAAISMTHGGGSQLQFCEPSQFFGPSDASRRASANAIGKSIPPPPNEALKARAAFLGGYYPRVPIMLLLCGVQGSGKSTFCKQLLRVNAESWIHLSQDTINKGKPGKREQVEARARAAIQNGKCVLVDRMHLDPMQRKFFIDVAKSENAPVHVAVFKPPRNVILERVRNRTNHPGKVMGESGVRQASRALDKLEMPSYSEEIELITCVSTAQRVGWLASLYGNMMGGASGFYFPHCEIPASDNFKMPTISLGTMGMGKRKAKEIVLSMIDSGFGCIDTAPTYRNEEEIGKALSFSKSDTLCIVKIPKAATTTEKVRLSLDSTLGKLQLKQADLLLLHWPCDVMAAGTLSAVWKEMESYLNDGLCKALGVCNFNVGALASLLSVCTVRPVVNQVERHPLLAQWDLLDFCTQNDIFLQAHSPLGQGSDELLNQPLLKCIASETSMSTAQIVIRWNLQHGALVTPKCCTPDHANEILSTFALSSDQMKTIDSLDRGRRFVSPPFMYGTAVYCWGKQIRT
ncbi:unnamed protein product [Cylindrotheca closterium]|uniref:NADP-dependent oxidoreductase domain-containing protein n=1 Tax=Cylindrotheca closterium TaxID=2856 RepID=A0AAD2G228_9STRA|nr:unnamed protein product [Cylindrotheca closterium]